MKKILLFLVLVLMMSSCSKSQDMNWTSLVYEYSSGPLPPPYHHEYSIAINNDGSANMSYRLGYDANRPPLNYSFKIDDEAKMTLNEKLKDSRLLEGKIQAVPENQHPVGGSLSRVKVYIVDPDPNLDKPPVLFEAPYFPLKEYAKGLGDLYGYINSLIPPDVKADIEKQKAEFEQNEKK